MSDRSYYLQGLPHTFRAPRSEQTPRLDALAESVREVDEWYAAYVRSLTEEDFDQTVDFVFTSGKPARMRRERRLAPQPADAEPAPSAWRASRSDLRVSSLRQH